MKVFSAALLFSLLWLLMPPLLAAEDLLIADFEGRHYGAWKSEGEAFGRGPARGAFPGQMKVEGFEGRRLVNSFRGGDASTGKLISPPFTIERACLNFLIGRGRLCRGKRVWC